MTKKELLEYLTVVCDGEAAKYACEEAIRELREQIPGNYYRRGNQSLVYPVKPKEPNREEVIRTVSSPSKRSTLFVAMFEECGPWAFLIIGVAWFLLALFLTEGTGADEVAAMLWSVILIACIFIIDPILRKFSMDYKWEEFHEEVERKWNCALTEYNGRLVEYNNQHEIVEAKRVTLSNIIAGYEATKADIEKKLDALYARGVIYERFRNIIAVNQIREYLEIGVCNALEGENGAYALYFQDIRTEKICNSIHELRKALESAINNLAISQSRLVYEMRQTNANLQLLNEGISKSLDGIQSKMDGLSQALPVMNAQLSDLNAHARKIQDVVLTSTHNDYIVKRIQNMQNYEIKTRLQSPRS